MSLTTSLFIHSMIKKKLSRPAPRLYSPANTALELIDCFEIVLHIFNFIDGRFFEPQFHQTMETTLTIFSLLG